MQLKEMSWDITLWSFNIAWLVEHFFSWSWWHPYCNTQEDGPGAEAYGIPFPFAEPSLISSETFYVMPHIYLLNIIIIMAVVLPVVFVLRPLRLKKVSLYLASSLSASLICLTILVGIIGTNLTSSIGDRYTKYVEYRPVFMMQEGDTRCYKK